MEQRKLCVLVAAVGGNVSQGILKALARSDVARRVVGIDVSAAQMGIYTVDSGYIGPWASSPEFIPFLAKVCQKESVDVILSGCEPVLDVFVRERQRIESETGAVCPANTPEIHDICDDKGLTCQWLSGQGFNCPDFAFTEDQAGLMALLTKHGYPLVAKPRRGGGARGLIEVRDESDLDYVLRKRGYVLQEYLGDDESEYTVGCFCGKEGDILGSICMRRHLLAGTTYRAWLGEFPEVREESKRIVRALRPVGPCNVQLRVTPRGPVCIEINARFSGTTPIRAHYGFNEVDAFLRNHVLGETVTLPLVTDGVVMRYWNELYVGSGTYDVLERDGNISGGGGAEIENYGIHP